MMEPSETAHSPKWPVVMKMPPRVGAQPLGGDGVIAEPFFWCIRAPVQRFNLIMTIVIVGAVTAYGFLHYPHILGGVSLGAGFVAVIWCTSGALIWIDRVRVRGVLRDAPIGARGLALRCLLTPVVRRERAKWFSVSDWLAAYPEETSPRVVLEGVDVPTPQLPDDVFEETDLVSERRVTRAAKARWLATLIVSTCLCCFLMLQVRGKPSVIVWSALWFPLLIQVYVVAEFGNRLSLGAFHLRSVVVAPGSVSFSRIRGGPLRFERSDSVLLLYKVNRFVCARMCRVDGQTAMFAFRDGPRSPGLAQLLSRWCYPVLVKQEAVEGS